MTSVSNQQQEDPEITTPPPALVRKDGYKNAEEEELLSIYDTQSQSKKNMILCIMSAIGFLSTFDELVYVPALPLMMKEFNTTETMIFLTVAVYFFTMAIVGLIWGVLSDYYGRKPITTFALGALVLSSIGCYASPNIYIFLVCRALQGCFVSVASVLGPGTIADIYKPNHRGTAYGIFSAFFSAAAILGPALGGQMSRYYGWRAIFIFITIASLVLFISYITIVPETEQYKVICMYQNQRRITLLESDQVSKPILKNPWLPLLYLTDATITPYACVLAFGYLIVNCCSVLFSTSMAKPPYSYPAHIVGMLFVAIASAHLLGNIIGGKLSDIVAVKWFKVSKILEGRMIPGLICVVLTIVGLIMYGWTVQYGIHVSVPLLGLIISLFGIAASRPGILSYFTIKYQDQSASISSATNFLQALLSAVVLMFTGKAALLIDNGPFFTILAVGYFLTAIVAGVIIYRKFILSINPETKMLL